MLERLGNLERGFYELAAQVAALGIILGTQPNAFGEGGSGLAQVLDRVARRSERVEQERARTRWAFGAMITGVNLAIASASAYLKWRYP